MAETVIKGLVCPMTFNNTNSILTANGVCNKGACAWWVVTENKRDAALPEGTGKSTSGSCAITVIANKLNA